MKRFILIFSAALLVGNLTLPAEDAKPQGLAEAPVEATPAVSAPADSAKSPAPAAPESTGTATEPASSNSSNDPLDQPISLIPDNLPNTPKNSGISDSSLKESEKQLLKAKDQLASDDLKKRIRMREVKNQALKDDKIQAEMETAQNAKTDPEKRAALKRYYNALFDQMLKIDGSLKTEIEARRKIYLGRYEQNRVRSSDEPSDFDLRAEQ